MTKLSIVPPRDSRRVFTVTITKEVDILVLAEDEENAYEISQDFEDEIMDEADADFIVDALPDENIKLPGSWTTTALVYHNLTNKEDITVERAIEIHLSNRDDKRQLDMFKADDE